VLAVALCHLPGLPAQDKAAELSDDPDVERRLMQLPDGCEMQLVASEPTIVNPLSMNFDTRGRLWVLCAPRYPQLLPGQEPKDYVVILEDFDPTGRARKSTVFVDGLTVPTGIMPGDGGVYIGQGETLLHFRDTKGRGKADERKVVFTGFGTADTHHTLNTFRWGPDGALYFNQGIYINSTVETPYGPRKLFGGCVWQLRTDRLQLEVYDRSILPNNTWGHAFDPWGQSFLASAWPGAINLCLPDSPLHQTTTPDLVPDLKFTQVGAERHCGLEVVTGRHFPDDWQGNLLTGDFLAHRIYRYSLTDDGHRFVARLLPPLVVSKHRKFRPIDIKMGPDGAVYIADLYQQIIQHNQVDFRDPRRDHTRGRIWRVVRKDRPLLSIPKLADAALEEVLDQLKAPEQWTRQQAKRALAEREPKAVAAGLVTWVRDLKSADADLPHHLLEALWAYQTIGEVEPDLLRRLLRAEDARVRAAATRVLGYWHDRVADVDRLIEAQAGDPHPRVRLEAVLAAGRIPSAAAAQAALAALDRPTDPLLDFALRKTTQLLRPYWYPPFQSGQAVFGGNSKHLSFALQAIKAPDAVPALAALLEAGKVPAGNRAGVLQILAGLGDAQRQRLAWDAALADSVLTAAERTRILGALEEAARTRKAKPPAKLDQVKTLFADPDALTAAAAMRLAGTWKLEDLRGELNSWAGRVMTDAQRRAAAIDALVALGGPASVQELQRLSDSKLAFAVRRQAIIGLAALDVGRAATAAAALLQQPPQPGEDLEPLFTAFLRQRGGDRELIVSLKASPPARDAAKIGLRVLAGLGVPAPELTAVLRDSAGQPGKRRNFDSAERARLLALVQSQGDVVRGEGVFRRPDLACMQCHALGGAGGRVGPDLSAIGTSAQVDYLLESIVLPSKVVREGFTTAHVTTLNGKAYSGVVQRESATELVLRDPLRDAIVIPVKEIDEKRVGGSLMPDGLDQGLTDIELADLVRFLSELGRPGPLAITHVRVARAWQFLAAPPERLLVLDDAALAKVLQEPGMDWALVFSKVSGNLPLREAQAVANVPAVYLRCVIDVVIGGKIGLRLGDASGITLWVDGAPQKVQDTVGLEVAKGTHVVTFRIDRKGRVNPELRCELIDVTGSSAQAAFVTRR
jgi:putative heme-binding domain-containing protein